MLYMLKRMNGRGWLTLALAVAAGLLDRFYLLPREFDAAWFLPVMMGVSALAGALKGRREGKNNAAAERYKAERQNAIDKYEAGLSKAKRGERLRFANALAKQRGFAVPEFDASASEAMNLDLPAIPEYKSGGFMDLVGGLAGGVAQGTQLEAENSARRDSYPDSGYGAEEAGPPSSMIQGGPSSSPTSVPTSGDITGGGYVPFDPSAPSGQSDPYASVLKGTRYFSALSPSRGR